LTLQLPHEIGPATLVATETALIKHFNRSNRGIGGPSVNPAADHFNFWQFWHLVFFEVCETLPCGESFRILFSLCLSCGIRLATHDKRGTESTVVIWSGSFDLVF